MSKHSNPSLIISKPKSSNLFYGFSSFESELRSYSGSDPLSVWHEYIVWVEQAAGRREGNLKTLLEKCIKELKDDARYTQDGRFMDVWAKYANTTDNPREVYTFMFKGGICTARPELYVNWAWALEQAGNAKKAEKVFKQGVQNVGEEHREDLKRKHNHFQVRKRIPLHFIIFIPFMNE